MDRVKNATSEIRYYIQERKTGSFRKKEFKALRDAINRALDKWVGGEDVGVRKTIEEEQVFQEFFTAFTELLSAFSGNPASLSKAERTFLQKAVFHGTVYRYLGSIEHDNTERIEPKYNDIFVSWSKNPESTYVESKLYYPITKMQCEIKPPSYGIDLSIFLNRREHEAEVVFPTVKELITDIQYIIDEDEPDDET